MVWEMQFPDTRECEPLDRQYAEHLRKNIIPIQGRRRHLPPGAVYLSISKRVPSSHCTCGFRGEVRLEKLSMQSKAHASVHLMQYPRLESMRVYMPFDYSDETVFVVLMKSHTTPIIRGVVSGAI